MPWMVALGRCIACGAMFEFNPERVPSIRWKGEREPLCAECVRRANIIRADDGLEPIHVLPGAYEPAEVD